MKVLVIGGTGLISGVVARQLLARGDEVMLYTRGRSEWRPVDPDGSLPAPTLLQGDRRDYPTFEAQVQASAPPGGYDCVVDMIGYQAEDARSVVRAFRGRTGQVVFCSTSNVYRWPAARYPVREDAPLQPADGADDATDSPSSGSSSSAGSVGSSSSSSSPGSTSSGAQKAACEAILLAAHQRGDFPVTVVRLAHTYGEGRGLVHSLGAGTAYFDRIRKGKPIVVHGDGTSLWCACHADDAARALVAATRDARAAGRPYNVAGEEWLTWNAYTAAVAAALGVPAPRLVHIPTDLLAAAAPERTRQCASSLQFSKIFDTSAARAALGFRYTIPFQEGVRRTVAWLDRHGQIESCDDDPFYDALVAAWNRLGSDMVTDLVNELPVKPG